MKTINKGFTHIMKTIGIIGFGFVGRAIAHGFSLYSRVKVYDKYDNIYDSIEDTVNCSDFIFVSVPTPMNDDGSQNLSNLEDAIVSIEKVRKGNKIVIIKSTIIPGTTRKLAERFTNLSFVFSPEFLTQRTADLDFINPSRIILGGQKEVVDQVEEFHRGRFTCVPIFKTTWEGAELVKYMNNCFFATKIAFCNEFYDMAEAVGVPYTELRDMWLADGRIANSHTDVPGHDGCRGYGGKCYKKDINALIAWAKTKGLEATTCEAAEIVNERVREKKDWEEIVGALSSNNYDKKERKNGS